jgi:hypothetical protein
VVIAELFSNLAILPDDGWISANFGLWKNHSYSHSFSPFLD